jgi:transcriptional regulator with XRE-family HTH domain
MTHGEEWSRALHRRIAEAIKRGRGGRMTGHELADATVRLGYPITRSQIANYESGRKQGLDVAELLVIAAALDIAPLELLFPGEPDQALETLPGRTATTLAATNWFVGNPSWLADLRGVVDQLTRAIAPIQPAGIGGSEQFGAVTVTQEAPR